MPKATGRTRNSRRRVVISPTGTPKASTPRAAGTTVANRIGIVVSAMKPETAVSVTEKATFSRASAQ